MLTIVTSTASDLEKALVQRLGQDSVSSDEALRTLYSQDVWARAPHQCALVVSPRDTSSLADALSTVTAAGFAAVPRGGGMSYTGGYSPEEEGTVLFDITHMNRVLEINTDDMTVTVEAGATWQDLYHALKEKNLRTPFWGPLSGFNSTIGGGLSQNNAFFGAGTYGPTADSVTSLSVVLADGTVLETGTASTEHGSPFFRHYGPDLTGLFLGDSGALGFKATATFRLMPFPAVERWASFEFADKAGCVAAASALSRAGIGCEVFGFDPELQRVRMKRASLAADIKSLAGVVKGQKSILSGVKEAAKIAMAGRDFMDEAAYSLHIVCEGRHEAAVDADMADAQQLVLEAGGKEIENTIPKVIRGTPFTPPNTMIGPDGERWVPVHGIVPHSKALSTWAAIDALFETMAADFDRYGITAGYLITTLSTNGFLIEPVFLWPDALDDLHKASVEKDVLHRIKGFDENPAARAVVTKARKGVVEIFKGVGAAHFQIGRTYPYREGRKPAALSLLDALKQAVDPENRINPGALGFAVKSG